MTDVNLTRRSFLHASLMAGGLVAVPQFGRWFRPPEQRIFRQQDTTVTLVTFSWVSEHGRIYTHTERCVAFNGVVTIPPVDWGDSPPTPGPGSMHYALS